MKRISTLIIVMLVLLVHHANAQDNSLPGDGFSFGITAGEYGYDAGIGIEVGTPCFRSTSLCLRIKGTVAWLEPYKATFDEWARYESLNVSMVYNVFTFERSRGYAEIGTFMLFPDQKFSERKSHQGATTSMGVELFIVAKPDFHMCYYFSGGFSYARAYADKLENNPRYGTGFVFNNGFRFYF